MYKSRPDRNTDRLDEKKLELNRIGVFLFHKVSGLNDPVIVSLPQSELLSQISCSHSLAREYFGHERRALKDPPENDRYRIPGKGTLSFVAYEIEPPHVFIAHDLL